MKDFHYCWISNVMTILYTSTCNYLLLCSNPLKVQSRLSYAVYIIMYYNTWSSSNISNIKTYDQTNSYMYCVSYWQLIKVCDICIPGIKFYQNIKPYIQIHFQMEIKPSTNSAAFIENTKKKPSENEWAGQENLNTSCFYLKAI